MPSALDVAGGDAVGAGQGVELADGVVVGGHHDGGLDAGGTGGPGPQDGGHGGVVDLGADAVVGEVGVQGGGVTAA